MAKYVIYLPGSDSLMMDGGKPYIDEEKEIKRVISEETCNPKNYEAKPVSFLKKWQERQDREEAEKSKTPYAFSPPSPEFRYRAPQDQKRYLLVVGEAYKSKSGILVKDFDTREEAARLANRSIEKLTTEFPNLAYFILDTEAYGYTDTIDVVRDKQRS